MPFDYTCEACKKTFTRHQRSPNARYCSYLCKDTARLLILDPDEIERLYKEDWCIEQIARHVGTSRTPVIKALQRAGYELKDYSQKAAEMVKLYEEGLSLSRIAQRLGSTRHTVSKVVSAHGYEIRGNGAYPQYDRMGEKNHQWKGGKDKTDHSGYVRVYAPDHPRSNKDNYIFEHILVMEAHIGRHLVWIKSGHPDNEIVHHKNRVRDDNRLENLELMTSAAHIALHYAERDEVGSKTVKIEMPIALYKQIRRLLKAKGSSMTSFLIDWAKIGVEETAHYRKPLKKVA